MARHDACNLLDDEHNEVEARLNARTGRRDPAPVDDEREKMFPQARAGLDPWLLADRLQARKSELLGLQPLVTVATKRCGSTRGTGRLPAAGAAGPAVAQPA